MYFTSGSDRAFEQLMQTRPGADHFDSGEAGAPEDCGTCRFYRPHWKYQFCVYEECPYQPGKRTALDGAVKFQVKGVDDEMAVFRVEKNRGYTVMSNHHLRNKDLSLKAKGLLSQMLSLPEDWDFTLKGLSLINREQIDAIRAAVKELEQAGYIVRSRERDSQGRLRGADYIIYEQPQPVPDSPTLENPTLDNPTQEKPTQEKPTQLNKDRSSKEKSITDGSNTDSIPILSPPSPLGEEAAAPPERKGTGAKSQSAVEIYREIIKDNIEYEHLCQYAKGIDRDMLDEIVDLLVETVCSARKTIRIAGDDYPAELVKSKLMKLNSSHIEFVFDCISKNTTEIRNIKKYLLAVLFNAPSTINGYYTALVAHDMNTGKTVYDEAKGKAKSRLYFDKVEKAPPQLKPNPASRPIQEAGLYLHGKIHEVEHENVGVEGGHKGEELAERQAGRMIHSGVHRHKLKPYRAAAKAERKSIAANAEFAYQKSLRDNPELAQAAKNPVSRFWQKQHIKREYAKAARAAGQTAQGAASTAKTTAAAAKKAAEKSRQAASFAARHWKGALIVGGVGLMLLLVMGGLQSCTAMFGSTGTVLAATSYLSEDSDMLGAEAAYAALEADLQHELDNYESLHPGYDEYRFDLDEIKHDPYVLTSILSALHNGVFTLGEVQGDLAMAFMPEGG